MEENKKYKIFVINLDRSPKRLEGMRNQFERLGMPFERFSAIDGSKASDELLDSFYSKTLNRKKYFVSLSRNEIACYISHIKACEKIISENLDYGIILEDDLILNPIFKLIPCAIEKINQNWNYIKLSAPFRQKKIISRTPIVIENCEEEKKSNFTFELVRWNKVPMGSQIYAISQEGAKKLLQKRSVFFRPADVDLQFPWETKLNIVGLLPFSATIADVSSDINHIKAPPHYPLARIIYKLKYTLTKFFFKNSCS